MPDAGDIEVTTADGGHQVSVFDGERWQPVAGGAGPAPPVPGMGVFDAISAVQVLRLPGVRVGPLPSIQERYVAAWQRAQSDG